MANLFTDLQEAIAGRLAADDYFSDALSGTPKPITVLTEKAGDLEAKIAQAINQIGISPLVITPKISPLPQPDAVKVELVVAVTENPVVNRGQTGTQKPAIDVGLNIYGLLVNWVPPGNWSRLIFSGMELVETTPLIYEVRFQTGIVLSIS